MPTTIAVRNLVLKSLPEATLKAVLSVAEIVHYDLKEHVIDPGRNITAVDFPQVGVISFLQPMEDGTMIELTTIGSEGIVGVSLLLGVDKIPEIAFCQVPGSAIRVHKADFLKLAENYPDFRRICQRYCITLFDQVARNTGCNRTHTIDERCARWLLMTDDRSDGNNFVMTQEFLASMLGVSRTGVNIAAGALSKAGLISYVRGKITILDRPGLEKITCECYYAMIEYSKDTLGLLDKKI